MKISEFIQASRFGEFLTEKLIMINSGKKYGQIVFLAGGAGSGKGFAISNFINSSDFKIRDVDEWKRIFLSISKMKSKYPEIRNLNLSIPEDVRTLHLFIQKLNLKDKTLELLLQNMVKGRLPNIIFDVTLRNKQVLDIIPKLIEIGYQKTDIHLIWVLANYHIAVYNNKTRERIVPDDILLDTHVNAAKTFYDIIKNTLPPGFDGEIYVILNNRENTIYYTDKEGNPIKNSKGSFTIKDFKYIKIKSKGKKIDTKSEVLKTLKKWVIENIPKT